MGNKTWIVVTVLLVLLAIFGTAIYFQSQKIKEQNSTSSSTLTPSTIPSATIVNNTKSDKDLIKEALVAKHGWNADEIAVSISKNDGTYATGSVGPATPGPGGGLFFAKKVNGSWQIVWDGNGIITCDDLKNYSDFPKDLIPQCYDSASGNMVTR